MPETKAKPSSVKLGQSTTRVIVEGEPVQQGVFVPVDLGSTPDESSPQPEPKAIAKLADEKLDQAAGDAGFNSAQAQSLLLATDVEPLWVPDNEKLSVYANPIAKQTHDNDK